MKNNNVKQNHSITIDYTKIINIPSYLNIHYIHYSYNFLKTKFNHHNLFH